MTHVTSYCLRWALLLCVLLSGRAVLAQQPSLAQLKQSLRQVDSQASQLQADVLKVRQLGQHVRSQLNTTVSQVAVMRRELAQLEQDIEERQPENTEFGLARQHYLAAQEKYQRLLKQMADSDEYRAAVQRASLGGNQSQQVAAVRDQILERNPEIQHAKSELSATRNRYQSLRGTTLKADAAWGEANSKLSGAVAEQRSLQKQLDEAAAMYSAAGRRLQYAGSLAMQLRQEIARHDKPASSPPKAKGKKKKKKK